MLYRCCYIFLFFHCETRHIDSCWIFISCCWIYCNRVVPDKNIPFIKNRCFLHFFLLYFCIIFDSTLYIHLVLCTIFVLTFYNFFSFWYTSIYIFFEFCFFYVQVFTNFFFIFFWKFFYLHFSFIIFFFWLVFLLYTASFIYTFC